MKTLKLAVMGALIATSAVSTVAQAAAAWTGNVALTNNYLWRGVTQTSDQAAIQGGMDYDFGNNFTIGAWISNVTGGTELDLYGAYKINLGKDMSLDVGAIKYKYLAIDNVDFLEAFAKFNYQKLAVGAFLTLDQDASPTQEEDLYLMASYSFDIGKDKTLALTVGDYDYDNPNTEDYSHLRAALTKGEFTFAFDDNDKNGNAGDSRLSITWAKSFDM